MNNCILIHQFHLWLILGTTGLFGQDNPVFRFDFENDLKSDIYELNGEGFTFVSGIDGQALNLGSDHLDPGLTLDEMIFDGASDFSIQYWIKTTSSRPMKILSQKLFPDKGIIAQQNPGWVLYASGGTFAWCIGSGDRRINYERDNGGRMPLNDGQWHQLTMTYNKNEREFRLYFDGVNKAVYKVNFDFSSREQFQIGSIKGNNSDASILSSHILEGQERLQELVDLFNELGTKRLKDDELIDLIVEPEKLYSEKYEIEDDKRKVDLSDLLEARGRLIANPYTVFQNRSLTNLKPVSKIYQLSDGAVIINNTQGRKYTGAEKLSMPRFSIDMLAAWDRTLSDAEVLENYNKYQKSTSSSPMRNRDELNIGVWNIWHGGIHWTLENDGWDSRERIVEMIRDHEIDVVLMQETYSSGDFIAAELGYYFATTSDWDYRYQGANISVMSRYPIKEVRVSEETEFNNVAARIEISEEQQVWAMSNWYGMSQFRKVFEFHKSSFNESDQTPVIFGGDFNAVPHTDGGESLASELLLNEGFKDAYRLSYPDANKDPGFTHRSDQRIDQLYFKGRGLKHKSTEVISSWPKGFPSDHYLIVSKFNLAY